MNSRHYIIPIFVPHKGCPHDCIFCNQKKITGQESETTAGEVRSIIERYLETIAPDNACIEVAFYGGSFTAIPIEQQSELLGVAFEYLRLGAINNIRVSTRPDYIDEIILDNLKKYGVSIVELGVQSMDEEVLSISQRGHNAEDVIRAAGLLKEYGFTLGVQMMVGLPGDNREKAIRTAKRLIELKPDIARIYPALIIKNTYMETMYQKGVYTPISLEEAVELSRDILVLFEKNEIEVIRIGLQPTDNIELGKDIVAGPFHPSMRQLVDSLIYRDMLDCLVKDIDIKDKSIKITVNPKEISNLLGQKKANIIYIKSKYQPERISIIQDHNLPKKCLMLDNVEYQKYMTKKDYYSTKNI